MTNIDIFSGFLGAGKTTLIKKLIKESFAGQKVVLIENEFGEIGIDGGFLKESGIQINELNAGCICCSLVGDFRTALQQVVEQYHPDRIVIEPSGVGKLSDVTRAVEGVAEHLDVKLNSFVTVADVNKVKMYMKNFGEFYDDQISHASCIILSRTGSAAGLTHQRREIKVDRAAGRAGLGGRGAGDGHAVLVERNGDSSGRREGGGDGGVHVIIAGPGKVDRVAVEGNVASVPPDQAAQRDDAANSYRRGSLHGSVQSRFTTHNTLLSKLKGGPPAPPITRPKGPELFPLGKKLLRCCRCRCSRRMRG